MHCALIIASDHVDARGLGREDPVDADGTRLVREARDGRFGNHVRMVGGS